MSVNPILPARGAIEKWLMSSDALMREMEEIAKDIKKDYDSTTASWKKRPNFVIKKGKFSCKIYTEDDVYRFLDKGTSVRYATMSPDFAPKTGVRVIGSRAGSGKKVYVNMAKPKPGIEARHFTDEITEKWKPIVADRLAAAILPQK